MKIISDVTIIAMRMVSAVTRGRGGRKLTPAQQARLDEMERDYEASMARRRSSGAEVQADQNDPNISGSRRSL
jgi:hypothetical protein